MENQCARDLRHRFFRNLEVPLEVIQKLGQMGIQFAPITNLLNAIDDVKHQTTYIPRIANSPLVNAQNNTQPINLVSSLENVGNCGSSQQL